MRVIAAEYYHREARSFRLCCINQLERSSPASGGRSSGNLEELVYKADLIADATLAREAVSAPDHSHDLESLDCGCRCAHGLKAACGSYHPLGLCCINSLERSFGILGK